MTQTLQRPASPSMPRRRTAPSAPRRWLLGAGSSAALRVAGVGLLVVGLPVLLSWATDARAGAGAPDAFRSAGQLWLLAHGVSLEVPDGRVGLSPLGLSALPLALLVRAGRQAAPQCRISSPRAAFTLALAVAVPYALLATLVAVLCSTATVRPVPVQALLGGLAMGLAGAGAGALRPGRLWQAGWLALPSRARRLIPAVAGASAVLLVGGALVVGLSLARHLGRAAELAGASAPGPVGGVALLLLGLSLVPNAVLWGASWLAGPGFAVGVGTSVGPFGYELGPVPSLPLLAALPGSGVPGWVGVLALLVPLAAGALAGRLVLRELATSASGPSLSTRRTVLEAAAAGPACGLLWVVFAWLAGGPVGGARLAEVGPAPWQVGLALAVQVSLGAVAAALLLCRRAA